MRTHIGNLILSLCFAAASPALAGGHLEHEKGHGKEGKAHEEPPLTATAALNAVALNVADIPRAEKYYTEVFGMRRVFQYPAEGTPIEIGLSLPTQPSAILLLARFSDKPLPEGKRAYGRFVIYTDDAWQLARRAEARGSEPRQVGGDEGPLLLFFNDLDGYEIELYQAR